MISISSEHIEPLLSKSIKRNILSFFVSIVASESVQSITIVTNIVMALILEQKVEILETIFRW